MQTGDTREEGLDGRARKLGLVGSQPAEFDNHRNERGYDCRRSVPDLIRDSDTTCRGVAEDRTTRRLLGPLRQHPIRRLLTGNLISKTGDWLTVGALMGWVYQETGSTSNVALLMLIRLVPPILGGAVRWLSAQTGVLSRDAFPEGYLMHYRNTLRAAALAAVFTLAPASSAFAAVAAPVASLAAGSNAMTLSSTSTLANGLVQSTWQGADGTTDTMVAAPGSTLSIGTATLDGHPVTTATVTPPQAIAAAPTTGTNLPASDTAAAASWTNPRNHTWFNFLTNQICEAGECVYGASQQYAYNETSGNWIIGQKVTGTISPGSQGQSCMGSLYTRFPNETGDSGPLAGYSPNSDTSSSAGTYNVSYTWGGFTIGSSVNRTGSVFGPMTPNLTSNGSLNFKLPAFGSRWNGWDYAGCTQRAEGLGSADAIHLGHHQNPYDAMIESVFTDK